MKVRLYIRIHLADGNRQYIDPVYAANGRIKPLSARVNGVSEHHPEGVYHLRYVRNGKRVWEKIGSDPIAVGRVDLKLPASGHSLSEIAVSQSPQHPTKSAN